MRPSRVALWLGTLFFLSGAAGLVYEVLWFRLLILRLGGTGMSVATVTAAFMAGLGIGAWLFGTRLALRAHPLRVYAVLELGVGVYALLVPSLVALVGRLDAALLGAEPGAAGRVIRFLLAGAALLPPTFCMGGTLPVLARLAVGRDGAPSRFVGWLYGLNTTGAVLGAGIAGFVLMPELGLGTTIRLVAALNLALGVVALLLSSRVVLASREQDGSGSPAHRGEAPHLPLGVSASFVSGFVAFILQVSWTRILALTFGSSVYAFSLILVIFLLGLGAGAFSGAWAAGRARSARSVLAWCFLGAGATALLGEAWYGLLPRLYLDAIVSSGQRNALGGAAWMALALMFPPTFFLGMGFPLVVRIATGDREAAVAAGVGRLYAGNTAGSVLGAFSTALVLIPLLGLGGAVTLAAFLALALAGFLGVEGTAALRTRLLVPALAAGVVLLSIAALPRWDQSLMTTGVGIWGPRAVAAGRDVHEDLRALASDRIAFYRDGVTATVTVKEATLGTRVHRYMAIDGKIDASNGSDMPTQTLSGHYPLLVGPPRGADVLVIGYASGVTVGAALTHEVASLTVVEIEGQVAAASHHFDDINGKPLEDPRTRLVVNDARAYLERTERTFDVIISEPSSVWLTGPSKLFTREAFQAIHARLKPGGVLGQWLNTYDLDPADIWTVVRTLRGTFAHVAILSLVRDADLFLLASDGPIRFDAARLEEACRDPKVEENLRRVGAASVCGMLEHVVAGPEVVDAALAPGPINTDDNAWLEYRGALTVGNLGERAVIDRLDASSLGPASLVDFGPQAPRGAAGALAARCRDAGAQLAALSLARLALSHARNADASWVLGERARDAAQREDALVRFREALDIDVAHRRSLVSTALTLQEMNRLPESLLAWTRAAGMVKDDPLVPAYRGLVRLHLGDHAGARDDFRAARTLTADRPAPLPLDLYEAVALQGLRDDASARPLLERFLGPAAGRNETTPEVVAALERLARATAALPGGGARAEDLARRASAGRRVLVPSILSEASRILEEGDEAAVRAYLRDVVELDPALRGDLERGASGLPEGAQRERLMAFVRQAGG